MTDIEKRLEELSISLPAPPSALGTYVGAVTTGNLVFVSGHGTAKPDGSYLTGKVPTECSEEEAYQAARLVGLNVLATLKKHLGDLDRVQRVVKVLGMVNSDPSFVEQPAVFVLLLDAQF